MAVPSGRELRELHITVPLAPSTVTVSHVLRHPEPWVHCIHESHRHQVQHELAGWSAHPEGQASTAPLGPPLTLGGQLKRGQQKGR